MALSNKTNLSFPTKQGSSWRMLLFVCFWMCWVSNQDSGADILLSPGASSTRTLFHPSIKNTSSVRIRHHTPLPSVHVVLLTYVPGSQLCPSGSLALGSQLPLHHTGQHSHCTVASIMGWCAVFHFSPPTPRPQLLVPQTTLPVKSNPPLPYFCPITLLWFDCAPQSSHVENLILNVVVLGGGA